jgi:hypothetical protein
MMQTKDVFMKKFEFGKYMQHSSVWDFFAICPLNLLRL